MSTCDKLTRFEFTDGKMMVDENGRYLNVNELICQIDAMVSELDYSIEQAEKWKDEYNLQRIESDRWARVYLLQLKSNIKPNK